MVETIEMSLKGQLGDRSPGGRLVEAAIEDSSVEAVWKMYSAARASLPYKERMDNLTWRMLGMRMRRIHAQGPFQDDVEMECEGTLEPEDEFVSSTEALDIYNLKSSVNPLNTVLLNTPEFHDAPGQHHYGSFSNHAQAAGFLSSADVHNQFNLFDTGFSDQADDQLIMDFSKSSPAIISEASDSNGRDRMSMMASDVLAGQSAGSVFRDSSAVTPTIPDQSNFLDHFFPSSIIGATPDAHESNSIVVPPVATPKPTKKLRQQNSTVTQARRGSGVKKKPLPLRNVSTTSLSSLGNDSGTPGPSIPQEPAKDAAKDGGKDTRCSNCHTKTTPLWRRDPVGNPLCNACGLFLKLHGVVRPLSLKTDVIKKRQRNTNTSKQSKSSSPNLEDPRQTRKTLASIGAKKRSNVNLRDTGSMSPATLTNSLSRVSSNLETSERDRQFTRSAERGRLAETMTNDYNDDTGNFNDNNNNTNTNNTNDDAHANSNRFDFFPSGDLSMMDDTKTSNLPVHTGVDAGDQKQPKKDESRPQQNGATGNTNWEWLSLSL